MGRDAKREAIEVAPDPTFRARIAADPLYCIESCLKIVPKMGGLEPLRLNDEQLEVYRIIWAAISTGKAVRLVILKARQLGISTLLEALGYQITSTRAHTQGLVLSHDRDSAHWLLQMSQRFAAYDTRHERDGMPLMSNLNKNELTFDNPDWRQRNSKPGLGSSLRIATADNRSAGHSKTIQFFHGSEVARWKVPELLAGVLNAIPDGPGTFAALESTANGPSGIFYDIWKSAEAGRNEWTPVFLSWLGRPEYSSKIPHGYEFEPSREELVLMSTHGMTAEEGMWRRQKIASPACQGQGRPPVDVFREQFPMTPEEAFVSTGRSYFDLRVSAAMVEKAKAMTYLEGDVELDGPLVKGLKQPFPNAHFIARRGGSLRIWKEPVAGRDYVVGADVAAGISGGDFQVAYVMDRAAYEYVARLRCSEDPIRFATDIMALAKLYNEAFLAPEANAIGLIVAKKCQDHYRRLCYHTNLASTDMEADTDRPGWYTTSSNRKQMFASFRQSLLDGETKIWCEDFHSELQHFVVPEGSLGELRENAPRALRRKHDDCIMAATITHWVNNPEIAGPILKPKATPTIAATWQQAAMMKDTEREGQKKERQRYYDDTVGEY